MTNTETIVRTGLSRLAENIDPVLPPFPTLPIEHNPRVPRRVVALAIAGGALGLAGVTAAATGTIPSEVRDIFREFEEYEDPFPVLPDDAELVASAPMSEGGRAEYWLADATDGGRCEFVRYVNSAGAHVEKGWSSCSHGVGQGSGMPGLFTVASPTHTRRLAGHAPDGTVALVVHFSDGVEERVPVDPNGFFIAELGDEKLDGRGTIVLVEAVNDNGAVMDQTRYR